MLIENKPCLPILSPKKFPSIENKPCLPILSPKKFPSELPVFSLGSFQVQTSLYWNYRKYIAQNIRLYWNYRKYIAQNIRDEEVQLQMTCLSILNSTHTPVKRHK